MKEQKTVPDDNFQDNEPLRINLCDEPIPQFKLKNLGPETGVICEAGIIHKT